MPSYFIVANSFAAPFFSDRSDAFIDAADVASALESFAASYSHPCGLYAAACFSSADAYHKNEEPLARWLCNHAIEKQRITKDLGCYSELGHGPGRFEINGTIHVVDNPKDGRVVDEPVKEPARSAQGEAE